MFFLLIIYISLQITAIETCTKNNQLCDSIKGNVVQCSDAFNDGMDDVIIIDEEPYNNSKSAFKTASDIYHSNNKESTSTNDNLAFVSAKSLLNGNGTLSNNNCLEKSNNRDKQLIAPGSVKSGFVSASYLLTQKNDSISKDATLKQKEKASSKTVEPELKVKSQRKASVGKRDSTKTAPNVSKRATKKIVAPQKKSAASIYDMIVEGSKRNVEKFGMFVGEQPQAKTEEQLDILIEDSMNTERDTKKKRKINDLFEIDNPAPSKKIKETKQVQKNLSSS